MKRGLILLLTLSAMLALAACSGGTADRSDASAHSSGQWDVSSVQTEKSEPSGEAIQDEFSGQTSASAVLTDLTLAELADAHEAVYAYYDQYGPTVLLLTEVAPQTGEVAFVASFMEDNAANRTIELVRQDGQWVVVCEG